MQRQKKKLSVLVTGANGFIGRNLVTKLREEKNFVVSTFQRENHPDQLRSLLKDCQFVIHLAGENRPSHASGFTKSNIALTQLLFNGVEQEYLKNNRKIKIIFTSSTQALQETDYGKSKLKSEQILEGLSKKYAIPVSIYRLPGVFGKWCRPNYNSVVATFCYNISRNIPIKISDPEKPLRLVYIDDVVEKFVSELKVKSNVEFSGEVTPQYQIKLGSLVEKIESFNKYDQNLMLGTVGVGLDRALYATFLSYLPKNKFSYSLPQHEDTRGTFVEIFKTENSGQISFFTAHPGITRGGHYHHTKTEKFLVVKGLAKFKFRDIITDETIEIVTSSSNYEIVDMIPGYAHNITNIGDEELIVILWASENFDKNRPDTISNEVF